MSLSSAYSLVRYWIVAGSSAGGPLIFDALLLTLVLFLLVEQWQGDLLLLAFGSAMFSPASIFSLESQLKAGLLCIFCQLSTAYLPCAKPLKVVAEIME